MSLVVFINESFDLSPVLNDMLVLLKHLVSLVKSVSHSCINAHSQDSVEADSSVQNYLSVLPCYKH